MADIFISYAKTDRSRVEPLAKALEERGWTVWWDPIIPTGKDFDEVIEDELSKARCVIVVWTKRSVKSKYVKGEAREALNRDILVPIEIESGIKPPFDFRSIQTLSLINWDGSDNFPGFQKLITDIIRILGELPVEEEKRKREKAERGAEKERRRKQEEEQGFREEAQKLIQLQEHLTHLAPEVEQAKGGRVLWIADKPDKITKEKMLLRSLGIEIVTTKPDQTNTEPIMRKIEEDNDFDLIISGIQWRDKEGHPTYGGIEFIKYLRENYSDPIIPSLPIVFYTGYRPDQVSKIIKQVEVEHFPKFDFCYSIEDLVENAIRTVVESRSNEIKLGKKTST